MHPLELSLQMLLSEAFNETDPAELQSKLDKIEGMITERIMQPVPPSEGERRAMALIFSQIDELRIHKLGYPDWRKFAGQTPPPLHEPF